MTARVVREPMGRFECVASPCIWILPAFVPVCSSLLVPVWFVCFVGLSLIHSLPVSASFEAPQRVSAAQNRTFQRASDAASHGSSRALVPSCGSRQTRVQRPLRETTSCLYSDVQFKRKKAP